MSSTIWSWIFYRRTKPPSESAARAELVLITDRASQLVPSPNLVQSSF